MLLEFEFPLSPPSQGLLPSSKGIPSPGSQTHPLNLPRTGCLSSQLWSVTVPHRPTALSLTSVLSQGAFLGGVK